MSVFTPVIGTFGAAGISAPFQPSPNQLFNAFIFGTFVGTAALVRSIDGGATWVPVTNVNQTGALTTTVPLSFILSEPDAQVLWAISTQAAQGGAYTSGTISYRLG